jgi:hypothetical protein
MPVFPTGVGMTNDESGKTTQLPDKPAGVNGFNPLHWTNDDYIFNFPYSSHTPVQNRSEFDDNRLSWLPGGHSFLKPAAGDSVRKWGVNRRR